MPIPPGYAYGDIGNNPKFILFLNYLIFCIFDIMKSKTCFWVVTHIDTSHVNEDVGPRHPDGFPRRH